jgi:hypothetical protein
MIRFVRCNSIWCVRKRIDRFKSFVALIERLAGGFHCTFSLFIFVLVALKFNKFHIFSIEIILRGTPVGKKMSTHFATE